MAAELMQIVLAWAEKTKMVPTGRTVRRDLNYFPEYALDWEGKACMWANKGNRTDLGNARQYAKREGYLVFTFKLAETDVLNLAKARAVEHFKKAEAQHQ